MKHTWNVTTVLILLFVISQIIGMSLLTLSQEVIQEPDGTIKVDYKQTSLGERPDTQGAQSIVFLVIGVAAGTIILLILAKLGWSRIWKVWFFLAVTTALTIALEVIIKPAAAFITGALLAAWKIIRPNVWVHNITEILVYSGIAILLVPLFDIVSAIIVLILFSLYDAYAVWKSKHMITLAKFQTKSKLFAGLSIAYNSKSKAKELPRAPEPTKTTKRKSQAKTRNAILGGGDIAIPLIFTGTVIAYLIEKGYSKIAALSISTIITMSATAALLGLFVYAKKDRYYPAIPPLTAGCLIGLGIIMIKNNNRINSCTK